MSRGLTRKPVAHQKIAQRRKECTSW
ncbi:BnaAnng05870D [Brassica napus]|uniref:BnaAnng05870D protein n=1 Tax=Brassica napus TaxID=3708 RepID=A0A078HTR8_BRANA|nr:BnaAnng05870D [Brassica napus]